MSGSLSPTVAAAPTAVQFASNLLAMMAALNGQATDYNQGSEVRTFSEANGLTVEQQGIGNVALSLQALAYGAMSLFGITQSQATAATGTVTFATSIPVSGAPAAPQAVAIPSGALVQTAGGIQFATTSATVLSSGTSSVTVGIAATTAGTAGNVGSGAISGAPLTPLGYPLYVINSAPTSGGANAGTQSLALAQFTAKAASLGRASPIAVANAAIGVIATGTGEVVVKASAFEPWIAAGSGAGSGTAGFTLYVDNGTGTASASLLAAVSEWITGNATTGQDGYRPIGVPFAVSAAVPVYADVAVTGVLLPGLLGSGTVDGAMTTGIQTYFNNLGLSPDSAYQPQVAAAAADAGLGAFSSLVVNLYYHAAPSTPVAVVSGATGTRVILNSLSTSITIASG